ncbi:MAG: tail fiber domain-containing protein [Bacteroidales bacterium]|nr:tail fiber domain-containing protein [Candidatus Scybalousia scybalohippi]
MTFSNKIKELMNSDYTSKNLILSFPDHEISDIDNSKIYQEEFHLEESLIDQDNLVFGKCNGAIVEIKVADFIENIDGARMDVTIVLTNDDMAMQAILKFGRYFITNVERTADRRHRIIKATDYMVLFDVDISNWYNTILFPTKETTRTVDTILDMLCEYIGVEYVKDFEFIHGNLEISKNIEPTSLSARDFLQQLLEINACFGHFNYDGQLEFFSMEKSSLYPSETLYPSNDLFPRGGNRDENQISLYRECEYEDYDVKSINSVSIQVNDDDLGVVCDNPKAATINRYNVVANTFLYGLSKEQLETVCRNLLNAMQNIVYRPNTTTLQGGMYLTLGTQYSLNNRIILEDRIIDNCFESYVLKRQIDGIQAMFTTVEANGNEWQPEVTQDVSTEYKQMQGKMYSFKRELDGFEQEYNDFKENTTTLIQQNADAITLESKKTTDLQNQLNGQVNKYSGSEVPTLDNYPYTSWDDNEKKENVGSIYRVNDKGGDDTGKSYRFMYLESTKEYYWQEIINEDIDELKAQVIELDASIEEAADSITSTVSKTMKMWYEYVDGRPIYIKYYNFGMPENNIKQWQKTALNNDLYLDQETGFVYEYKNKSWFKKYELELITNRLNSQIVQTADEITSTVSKSQDTWDVSKEINVKEYGYGTSWFDGKYNDSYYYKKTDELKVGDVYLDNMNGYGYSVELILDDGVNDILALFKTIPTYTFKKITDELSSRISQSAKGIILSVEEGNKEAGITIQLIDNDGNPISEDQGNIVLTGFVEFNDLAGTGTTTINGSNITTGTIDANKVTIDNLVVGENVEMGPNATISWGNVEDIPDDLAYEEDIPTTAQITKITKDTITTSTISCNQLNGGTISGQNINGGTINGSTFTSVNGLYKTEISGGVAKSSMFRIISATDGISFSGIARMNTDESAIISEIAFDSAGDITGNCNGFYIGSSLSFASLPYRKLCVGTGSTGGARGYFEGAVCPSSDAGTSCGASGYRWSNIYCKNSEINTSDINKKRDLSDISNEYEKLFFDLKPKTYFFKDGDRKHIGLIAQEVEESAINAGITPMDLAALCKDVKMKPCVDDNGNPIEEPDLDKDGNVVYEYSLRYSEFISLNTHMIQKAYKKIEQQQEEIDTLKEQVSFLMSKLEEV